MKWDNYNILLIWIHFNNQMFPKIILKNSEVYIIKSLFLGLVSGNEEFEEVYEAKYVLDE